ncbi:hypothetical protein [Streptomyces sp. GESEQ-35]|uniref:hypothetical protein n=1 Tax=Streptomyces sp. GESEQ-35 TaxID=2812657 RepID=UPI001B33A93F|nr:hypothetical protein [Streptomyces sp. GESEQ-35]
MSVYSVSPHAVRRLADLVTARPGRTIGEHVEAAEKILDRQLIQQTMPSLVRNRVVVRDDHGRLWPLEPS